jgi:hypothetical protein
MTSYIGAGMTTDTVKSNYLSKDLWNTQQAAKYLGYEPHTLAVWRCNKRYDLRPIKIGRSIRYCPVFVREFAEREFMMP